ncbi:pyruvate kinase [Sporomusaceae bacterium BoRhaA]|uniref:pyruvate kinase n=1 Tax=Pelorhabdus rhamnosifermentans TaxID=2772457 RepID=UPI001C061694|nr:pyruvate kinase [Pelorhabdus rhamnosifermentans]MBU2702203.1 pyruvate kinase [Pelorhabdus rhamnosifermentans]
MDLYETLYELRNEVFHEGMTLFSRWKPSIYRKSFLLSALNLSFYLALRCRDLRTLQKALLPFGLSSLGKSEAQALASLDAVLASLGRICNKPQAELMDYPNERTFFRGDKILTRNTRRLLGSPDSRRHVGIMVTLPTEAAANYSLIKKLMKSGMDAARINCAHDTAAQWEKMIAHIRQAEQATGKHCKIFMDLAGPKVRIAELLALAPETKLFTGDEFFLASGKITDYPTEYRGSIIITCNIPEIFTHLQPRDPLLIDDGKIEAKVSALTKQGAYIKITHAGPNGNKIKVQKSLNFPQTPFDLSPLTPKDLKDLNFIATHADAICYSFVKTAHDIELLQNELFQRVGNFYRTISLVAKIETSQAMENLPEIIVQAASKQPLGIMIARGDLAVEVGYRRLSELQEEILWICEAAHVPVIWSTQVLENLIKNGTPSRAEITDAAMGERAECVMLNKGPFIVQAVEILADILERMQHHQYKKAPQLRALNIAMNAAATLHTPKNG